MVIIGGVYMKLFLLNLVNGKPFSIKDFQNQGKLPKNTKKRASQTHKQ